MHNWSFCVKISQMTNKGSENIMSDVIAETPKKKMLSGIKPSGDLTLGSYLGAIKNWAERADYYD